MRAGRRFGLVLTGMAVVAAGLYASLLFTSSSPSSKRMHVEHARAARTHAKRWALDPATWGKVTMTGSEPCLKSSPCAMRIVLGPRLDRTWLYTLQTPWKGTMLTLEDHQPFDVADQL